MSSLRSIKRAREKTAGKTTTPSLRLPEEIAKQIQRADAELIGLRNQFQMGQMARENLILSAALEMGLTKQRLSELELAVEDGGLVFRKPAPPPAQQPSSQGA
jgi:hypothetical protein